MTEPVQPTPPAPANPPTPQPANAPTPQPPTPPAAPTPATSPAATPPWERDGQPFDPERAWRLVESLRSENTTLKQGRTSDQQSREQLTAEMAKLLGLGPDETDPAVLAEQIEAAQDQAWRNGVELALYRLSPTVGADMEKLLDSVQFIESLDDLPEGDPRSPEFTEALKAKVTAALERNPNLKAGQAPANTGGQAPNGPRPDPTQGARGGQPARPSSLGEALSRHYAKR